MNKGHIKTDKVNRITRTYFVYVTCACIYRWRGNVNVKKRSVYSILMNLIEQFRLSQKSSKFVSIMLKYKSIKCTFKKPLKGIEPTVLLPTLVTHNWGRQKLDCHLPLIIFRNEDVRSVFIICAKIRSI